MTAGRWVADERGAFDGDEPVAADRVAERGMATAPLYECAASHDGQPAAEWLALFYREHETWSR